MEFDLFPITDNCVSTTKRFLKILGISFDSNTLEQQVYAHPDHPSILCIGDTLDEYGVVNKVVKISVQQLFKLNMATIVSITEHGESSFAVINKIEASGLEIFDQHGRKSRISREAFERIWEGIALIYHVQENSYHKSEGSIFLTIKKVNSFIGLILVGSFMYLVLEYFLIQNQSLKFKLYELIFLLASIFGGILGFVLLTSEVEGSHPLFRKICIEGKKINCDAILGSKSAKIINGTISWGQVGFSFFLSSILVILFSDFSPNAFGLLGYLSILSISFVLYSIYFQIFRARKLCPPCLLTLGTLSIMALVAFSSDFLDTGFTLTTVFLFTLLYLLSFSFWSLLKSNFTNKKNRLELLRSFNQIKCRPEIFEKLLTTSTKMHQSPIDEIVINIGHINPKTGILVVLSPFCKACVQTFKELNKFVAKYGIGLKVVFSSREHEPIEKTKIAKYFMALEQNNYDMSLVISFWYELEDKKYEALASKYPTEVVMEKLDAKVVHTRLWCKKQQIKYTPTLFYKGFKISHEYNLKDLEYLLFRKDTY